ncbi:MAG: metalloregulator ArsR/SmtB family transcription factor [bacterium]|nr:metalloregulator ArsR/SmtB family transcription factor [bacterium]
MKKLEKVLKVFANSRRLAILQYLKSEGEARVSNIAKEISLSFKSTSRHMHVLFAGDLVEKDQRSLEVYYRLASHSTSLIKKVFDLL